MKKPETANDWLQILAAAGKRTEDKVPPGFKSATQIAKETGKSETQVRKYLREAVKLGLIEGAKFNVNTGDKLYPVPHYRIV